MITKISKPYRLDDQIGFILRRVLQTHTAVFAEHMIEGLTPTQFAALAKLYEKQTLSQNELGRHTAMDVATIKGVVDRLHLRGLIELQLDPADARRRLVTLTPAGHEMVKAAIPAGRRITETTLAPLNKQERTQLKELLLKIT